jgi:hypothetical protein
LIIAVSCLSLLLAGVCLAELASCAKQAKHSVWRCQSTTDQRGDYLIKLEFPTREAINLMIVFVSLI